MVRTRILHISDKRLACFIILSCLIHMMLAYSLPPMVKTDSLTSLKKPVWVDLMDIPGPSPNPGSLSPHPKPKQVIAKAPPLTQSEAAPKDILHKKAKETSLKKIPFPKDSAKTRKQPEPDPVTPESTPPLPSLNDLIPSMHSLLKKHQEDDPAFLSQYSQEGWERLPGNTQYERYLLELKRKVKKNWKVNLDTEIRQGSTVVWVIVAADGTLWSIDLLKPSGMILHDYEAIEAVKQAFPLSPPPKNLLNEKGHLPIRFSFHYLINPPS